MLKKKSNLFRKIFEIILFSEFPSIIALLHWHNWKTLNFRVYFATVKWQSWVMRIIVVSKEFFRDLWRERDRERERKRKRGDKGASSSLSLPSYALTSTWAKSIEAHRRRRRYGGNENLRKGIYPTCQNISSARSLTLYSDLFYASESGSARLQFRKVSRVPRVVCTPRVRDFGNLRVFRLVCSLQFFHWSSSYKWMCPVSERNVSHLFY